MKGDLTFDLLDSLIDDMEPFDQIIRSVRSDSATPTPSARDILLELLALEQRGLVSSAVLVNAETWRRPTQQDLDRLLTQVEGDLVRDVQSALWFDLTDAGRAEWRARSGPRDPSSLWRLAETQYRLEVRAATLELARDVVSTWRTQNPGRLLADEGIITPDLFTLTDGTRVAPGVRLTYRLRSVTDD